MIVEDLLRFMGSLNNELDTAAGAADEVKALNALNLSKIYVESVAAAMPRIMSARGVETIKTAANTESTPIPEDLLRIDRLWLLDSTSLLPIFPLEPLQETGAHQPPAPWPLSIGNTSPGQIAGYYIDGEHLYWSPPPDAIYQVRAYGLWQRDLFVDRKSAVPFPQILCPVIAAFATRYCLSAVDDPTTDILTIAKEFFAPALRALRKRDRSVPKSRHYERIHTT
jgi:hypothetical protein